jgi:hypothetical protein
VIYDYIFNFTIFFYFREKFFIRLNKFNLSFYVYIRTSWNRSTASTDLLIISIKKQISEEEDEEK